VVGNIFKCWRSNIKYILLNDFTNRYRSPKALNSSKTTRKLKQQVLPSLVRRPRRLKPEDIHLACPMGAILSCNLSRTLRTLYNNLIKAGDEAI
jgi:hypothetical protein